MLNSLTFDIEEWYHGNLFDFGEPEMARFQSRVAPATNELLDLLGAAGTKATFFFLGVVAREHPDLVRRAASESHEIACHGWRHRLLYELPDDEVRDDLYRAKALLEDISGARVLGFRAPSWSISGRTKTKNLLSLVSECGFHYDSSAFPGGTTLFGVRGIKSRPERVSGRGLGGDWSIVEVPAGAWSAGFGPKVPVGGGFFFRAYPYSLTRAWIERTNRRGCPALVYIHPWEMDRSLPRYISPVQRVARDLNLCSTRFKFERILRDFRMGRVIDVLHQEGLYE